MMYKANSLNLLIIFILFPLISMAQLPTVIIVTVTDTINVPGDEFSSFVEYFDSTALEEFEMLSRITDTSEFLSHLELTDLAKNANGKIRDNTTMSIGGEMRRRVFSVKFLSFDDRTVFESALDNVANIKVRTVSAKSTAVVVDDRIIGKILKTAQIRAATIAKELGYKLGDVLEVEELETDIFGGGWTAYPPLSIPPIRKVPVSPDKAIQSATYKFKFAAFN